MIIDGKQIASEILARTKVRAESLGKAPLVVALQGNDTLATRSYLAIKSKKAAEAGCRFEVRPLTADTSDADAVIVQLPLADGADVQSVLDAIPVKKDADVLSTWARAAFQANKEGVLLPPVAGAVREILERNSVTVKGKKVVVIGRGFLVGEPVSVWFRQQGADVEVLTSDSSDRLPEALRTAEVIVSGAGSPVLIKPEMIAPGVVLIDASTSESNGEIVGDADPACAEVASLFTPVPGGVGPIAVACLFENAVTLAEKAR